MLFSIPLIEAGSILSLLFNGNGTRETATSLIKSRLISMSPDEIEVGVDRASAFRFFATLELAAEYELPPEMFSLPPLLVVPVSITDVGASPGTNVLLVMLALPLTEGLGPLLPLVPPPTVFAPNTESEFTTMVSVKLDVVNFAIASFDSISLLLAV